MKHLIRLLLVIACILTASSAFAQVDVRLEPIRSEFLVGEEVAVKVTFTNHTDRTVTLKNTAELRWLNFHIDKRGQSYPVGAKALPKFPPVTLGPGSIRSFSVDLKPYFNLSQEGRYNVSATVVLEDGHTTRTSNRTTFTLSQGGTMKSFDIQARGQKLKVSLKLLNIREVGPCLFGQVAVEGSNNVLGACFMGKYLSFMKPCIRLDSAMNLHVLCQSTPEFFTYSIMNTFGKRSSMRTYRRSAGPVDLIATGGGLRPIGLLPYTPQAAKESSIHSAADRPNR